MIHPSFPSTAVAMHAIHVVCTLLFVQFSSTALLHTAQKQELADILPSVFAAVVRLDVQHAGGYRQASGFLVSGDGLIVTAGHAVEGARSARVRLRDGTECNLVSLVELDQVKDLAVIRIAITGAPHLKLGDSWNTRIGERVVVVGNPSPGGSLLEWSVTDGLLSGIRQATRHRRFQISAPVAEGSSGSPLLDQSGSVVGVVVSGFPGENFNFAIPSNYVTRALRRIGDGRGRALSAFLEPAQPGMECRSSESLIACLMTFDLILELSCDGSGGEVGVNSQWWLSLDDPEKLSIAREAARLLAHLESRGFLSVSVRSEDGAKLLSFYSIDDLLKR